MTRRHGATRQARVRLGGAPELVERGSGARKRRRGSSRGVGHVLDRRRGALLRRLGRGVCVVGGSAVRGGPEAGVARDQAGEARALVRERRVLCEKELVDGLEDGPDLGGLGLQASLVGRSKTMSYGDEFGDLGGIVHDRLGRPALDNHFRAAGRDELNLFARESAHGRDKTSDVSGNV